MKQSLSQLQKKWSANFRRLTVPPGKGNGIEKTMTIMRTVMTVVIFSENRIDYSVMNATLNGVKMFELQKICNFFSHSKCCSKLVMDAQF